MDQNQNNDQQMGQNQQSLDELKVAILVSDDFEQVEMTEPRKALDQAGAHTVLISTKNGEVHGMNHDQKADSFKVDMNIDQANPDDFDALLLPGGALNADKLRMDERAQQFAQRIDQTGKPIAVICHAPWLLVSSDLVNGRTLTSYYTIQDDIRNAGGNWVDRESVRDNNWVSSRNPHDIPAFNQAMLELFKEQVGQSQGIPTTGQTSMSQGNQQDMRSPSQMGEQGRQGTFGQHPQTTQKQDQQSTGYQNVQGRGGTNYMSGQGAEGGEQGAGGTPYEGGEQRQRPQDSASQETGQQEEQGQHHSYHHHDSPEDRARADQQQNTETQGGSFGQQPGMNDFGGGEIPPTGEENWRDHEDPDMMGDEDMNDGHS